MLTGLGHEIDRSVADEVAHTALKTPTACAGALIERTQRYIGETEQAFSSIVQRSEVALSDATNDLSEAAHRIARRTYAAVERSDERLKMRVDRLARSGPAALTRSTERLDRASARLLERPTDLLARSTQRLDVLAARVGALDPTVQLARGWTITHNAAGDLVRSTADLGVDDVATTTLADGTITSIVTATHLKDDTDA